MSRIIEARGPVVEALQRYDPGLRVRWSHEKEKWAVDAKFDLPNPNVLPKPVKFFRVGAGDFWQEVLLPEYSERNIQYTDHTYVVCYAKKVDWPLLWAIVNRDSHRHKNGLVGMFDQEMATRDAVKSKKQKHATSERVYAAWDRFRFDLRKNPNAEDGTGVSIKGYERQKLEAEDK